MAYQQDHKIGREIIGAVMKKLFTADLAMVGDF